MKYALTRRDGSVSIMSILTRGADPGMEIAKRPDKDDITGFHAISEADLPADRAYRNGWTLAGGKVAHDMAKCRELHREKLRQARAPRLAVLDVDYQRADEAGDARRKQEIARAKQELRDITALAEIDAAQTVDELKAIWPASLA